MKRVLTMVSAVLLAISFAVPSLAAGWDRLPEAAAPTGDFILTVTKVEYDKTFTPGGAYYMEWTGTAKPGTLIRFIVSLSVPESVPAYFDTAELKVTLNGITLTEGDKAHSGFSAGGSYSFMYAGYVTSDKASVTATLTMGREFDGGTFTFDDHLVTHTGDVFTVQHGTDTVAFTVDAVDRITSIAVNGTVLAYDVAGKANLGDFDMKALLSILSKLGISLDGDPGYMYEEGFTSRFGGNVKVEASAVYGVLRDDDTPVIAPVDILPPQTGDGASYLGAALLFVSAGVLCVALRKQES